MKPVKITLRFWIAITSILSFLGGWALLAHAGKPASLFSTTSSDTQAAASSGVNLAPIPSLDQLVGSPAPSASVVQLPAQSNINNSFLPRLRSRGS